MLTVKANKAWCQLIQIFYSIFMTLIEYDIHKIVVLKASNWIILTLQQYQREYIWLFESECFRIEHFGMPLKLYSLLDKIITLQLIRPFHSNILYIGGQKEPTKMAQAIKRKWKCNKRVCRMFFGLFFFYCE